MEGEACSTNDLPTIEDEIPWVTSGLYDAKREECQAVRRKDSLKLEELKKYQFRRQSEPVVSKIIDALSPNLIHQNKLPLYSTHDELDRFSFLHKGILKQTQMHTKSAENSPQIRRRYTSSEKCFVVNLFIESKKFHLGPFPFEIYPKMNVGLLKLKVEKELAIPPSYQKWILNKTLAIENNLSFLDCDVIPGSPIFLYLDSDFDKSIDLDQLYSLGKISAKTVTHKHINSSHFTGKQYPVKSTDPEKNGRFTSANAHNEIKNPPKKKCEKLILNEFEKHDGRKNKILQSEYENCSQNFVKVNPEEIFPSKDATAEPHQKRFPGSKKVPFKPVFGKVKEKKSVTQLNDMKFSNVGCSSKTFNSDVSASALKTANTTSKCQTLDHFGGKNIIKPKTQKEVGKMETDSNAEKSCQPVEDGTNVKDKKLSEYKKDDAHDLGKSDMNNKILMLPSKCGQNSILEKVRMKNKVKCQKENENTLSAENAQDIQNVVSYDKITEKSAQSVLDENRSQSDILSQSNHETKCSFHTYDSTKKIQLKSEITKIENNHKMDTSLSDQKEEPKPDFVEISTKNLETEEFTDSSEAKSSESYNIDVFRKAEITEICIVNNNDKPFPEIHSENFDSNQNMVDSSYCEIGQAVPIERNEEVIKKCPENYEHLLKMEDLNLVRNVVNFTCPVCFEDFESDQGVVLHECLHTFCIDCLARTIDYAEEVLIKCPYRDDEYSCQSFLQQREIKALVSPEIYERYLQRSIITAESLAEKSVHCNTPDCPGWCMFDDNINVFHCPVCFHYNCLNCHAIHEGLNCRQYQDKLQSQKKLDPDSEKTLEFLNKMIEGGKALKCPKCDLILMKKWGCDWLKCAICLTEICWITKGPRWGPGGQGDTSGGCRCGVNGVKCHPSCTYCH